MVDRRVGHPPDPAVNRVIDDQGLGDHGGVGVQRLTFEWGFEQRPVAVGETNPLTEGAVQQRFARCRRALLDNRQQTATVAVGGRYLGAGGVDDGGE